MRKSNLLFIHNQGCSGMKDAKTGRHIPGGTLAHNIANSVGFQYAKNTLLQGLLGRVGVAPKALAY